MSNNRLPHLCQYGNNADFPLPTTLGLGGTPSSLELGMFSGRLPGLDTISIGTELHWLHSKDEKFSISSVQGTWKFIQNLIPTLR